MVEIPLYEYINSFNNLIEGENHKRSCARNIELVLVRTIKLFTYCHFLILYSKHDRRFYLKFSDKKKVTDFKLNKKMRKTKPQRFYVYKEKKTGKQYFHNPITNNVTYFPPEGSIFIDSSTLQEISIDYQAITNQNNSNHIEELEKPNDMLSNASSYLQKRKRSRIDRRAHSSNSINRVLSRKSSILYSLASSNSIAASKIANSNLGLPIYLPQEITKDSENFDVRSFAQTYLNQRTCGSFFNKKEIPPDELLLYDIDLSVLRLLKKTPNSLKKKCDDIFNLVLDYCKQSPRAQPYVFVDMLFKDKILIDETYIILMKFIKNNP